MKRKNRIFLLFSVLVFSLACAAPAAIAGYFETVNIEVVSPAENYRITQEWQEGQPAFIDLQIRYTGTHESKIAIIEVDGINYSCTLYRNDEASPVNYCGPFPVKKLGEQTILVQVQKGEDLVVVGRQFLWQPYSKLENFLTGIGGDITSGSMIIIFAVFIVFALIVVIKTKGNLVSAFVIAWITTLPIAVLFLQVDAKEALLVIKSFISLWVLVSIIAGVHLISNNVMRNRYSAGKNENVKFSYRFSNGDEITASAEDNGLFKPADSGAVNELNKVVKEVIKKGGLRQLQPGKPTEEVIDVEAFEEGDVLYQEIKKYG